jgi:hypothetical protein
MLDAKPRKLILILLICLNLSISNFAVVHAASSIGGLISSDLVLTKSGSPYIMTSTLQIPAGLSVTVQPGVEIRTSGINTVFWNQGNLIFAGSKNDPIRVTGKFDLFISLKNAPLGSKLSIIGTLIDGGGTLWSFGGYSGYTEITMEDSELKDVFGYTYLWYPPNKVIIQRNVFINSGGFSIGFDAGDGKSSVSILNNLFIGASTTDYWIEAWASYGGQVEVHGNEFRSGPYTAVQLKPNYKDGKINASGNFWGTQSLTVIGTYVKDKSDGLEFADSIDVSSPLAQVPASVPSSSILKTEADFKAKQEADAKAAADKAAADKAAADKAVAELKAKQEADAKAAAELKAKQEADAKAAAELKAKQEADAKAAAELKAKQELDAKAAAELKAKQEADAKAKQDLDAKTTVEKLISDAKIEAARILADAQAKAQALTKKTTITCLKGKLIKKVTAVKPVCPAGYKKK